MLRSFVVLVSFLFLYQAYAFELVMIQAVSESKRTFITRNGKRQGVIQGSTGTFTAEDVSYLAKAVTVTGNYTQWELINKDANFPLEKGSLVTYYPATEYIWALAPESERRKYIKSQVPELKKSFVFKGALTRGLSESVSDVPASTTQRGGYMAEVYHERDFVHNFAYDFGLRYEREIVSYPASSFITSRALLIADVLYYFEILRDYINGRLFLAGGFGYGLSSTTGIGLTQSGAVAMLPTARLGLSLPFNQDWEFVTDGGFESLQTQERQENGNSQTTTQTNFKFGFGLRRFL